MDSWETYYRSSSSCESGASRSVNVLDQDHPDHALSYIGRLVANEQSATLNASGIAWNCLSPENSEDSHDDVSYPCTFLAQYSTVYLYARSTILVARSMCA